MKYLINNQQSRNLISKFLQDNLYMTTKIRIKEDSCFVAAAENGFLIGNMFDSMMSLNPRSVNVTSSYASEYVEDKLFTVNDYEFYSYFNGKTQICFTSEWREYMAKNLPEEQQEDYKKDLETFSKENIWKNI